MKSRRIVIRHRCEGEPIFWVIDAEQWPRACLRAELIERGYDAYGFIEVQEALNSLSRVEAAPKPALIILELRGQNLTKQLIDAIRNIGAHIIVLGGNAELNSTRSSINNRGMSS